MLRSFTIIPIVAIGLAMPAAAQHVSDQDARQAGESVVQAYNKASQAKDAAGVAALYSEDATYITPDGPISAERQFRSNMRKISNHSPWSRPSSIG